MIDLINKANKHHQNMIENKQDFTDNSVEKSIIYMEDYLFNNKNDNKEMTIIVEDIDSIFACYKYNNDKRVALLNFASFIYPGGAFLYGSYAQEEAICHESNLFEILNNEKFFDFYYKNKLDINNHLYYNRGIYSPSVLLTRNLSKCFVDIITVAAPNVRGSVNKTKDFDILNKKILRERIRFILNIAKENNVKVLILGAFGCGAFGQDSKTVATIFKEELQNISFNKVIFAIPDFGDKNLQVFTSIFTVN